jgi:hypothetical protein
VLALNAMGLPLLDFLRFEDLRRACEPAGRWEFLFVTAPLWIAGGTGSPVNPLAILQPTAVAASPHVTRIGRCFGPGGA